MTAAQEWRNIDDSRPRMEKSHSKRHEHIFCLVFSFVIVLNAMQIKLYFHYWYKVSLKYQDGEWNQKSTPGESPDVELVRNDLYS